MSSSPESNGYGVKKTPQSNGTGAKMSFKSYTKAERIKQLNDIDKNVTHLLRSAGMAVKTLTSVQPSLESNESSPKDFPSAANAYLEALHTIDIQLKRQIHGLVEARIVTKEAQSILGKSDQNQDAARGVADRGWDVGWLNTRSGKVGRDMEAELWAKAKGFLENLEIEENEVQRNMDTEDTEMAD